MRGGSCSCAPDSRCAAERPVNLAQPAPGHRACAGRPPLAVKPAEHQRQPPGPPSPLAQNAPACVCPRAAAWRLPRGARGRRVAGLSPAPSHTATAVHHFCRGARRYSRRCSVESGEPPLRAPIAPG